MNHARESARLNDSNLSHRHRRPAATTRPPTRRLAATCLALALAAPAATRDEDVYNINVFASDRYDSNLFRLPDGVQPFGNGRRSATTRSAGVNFQIDKTYGLQRFDLSTTNSHDSYDPYDFLDATARSYNASWAWTLTPSITGNLSINRSEAPNNFSDTGVIVEANKRRTEERRFDANWRPGAALHPRVSVTQNEDISDQTTFDRQNSKTTSIESALVYEFRSGNSADLYFRRGRGNYLDLNADPSAEADSQFDERETGISGHWRGTGTSALDGRLGYLDREHRTFASRNFSGPVGNLSFTYEFTGKTSLQLNASRTLSSIQSQTTSYSADETFSVTPVYSATSKITVRPSYSVTRRTFRGGLVDDGPDLRMIMRDTSLSVDYAVIRALSLSLSVTRSNRSANDRTYQFADHGASVSAAFRF